MSVSEPMLTEVPSAVPVLRYRWFAFGTLGIRYWLFVNDHAKALLAVLERQTELAHGIDETATYIRRQFERNNRRPNRDEARVMEQLRALNEQAARFHDDVESSRQNPRHTAREFAALENAFNDAARSLRRTGSRSYVNRGMVRIYTQMNELSGYYGRRAVPTDSAVAYSSSSRADSAPSGPTGVQVTAATIPPFGGTRFGWVGAGVRTGPSSPYGRSCASR